MSHSPGFAWDSARGAQGRQGRPERVRGDSGEETEYSARKESTRLAPPGTARLLPAGTTGAGAQGLRRAHAARTDWHNPQREPRSSRFFFPESDLMKKMTPIRYTVTPVNPQAHLFSVSCTVADPDSEGQRFSMPVWIPGSYLVREFARNIVGIRAHSNGREIGLRKQDKNTWAAAPCTGPITVEYEVYANDLSVRGAYLDTTRGFFNGPGVFLRVRRREHLRHEVELRAPEGGHFSGWRVATAMRRIKAKHWGFGSYFADDYDELIDHPVEMGEFSAASFTAAGVPHDVAIAGRHDTDMKRLCADLKKVCEAQIALWGEAPMARYLFLVLAVGDGYGGLEHRASTALIASRNDLPQADTPADDDNYRTFLGLCSHEYFHTWNVKRIKPEAFTPYDLDRENYTRLLWAFEGITSYYDDLMLVRAGLMSEKTYLETLGRTVTQVARGSGRLKQTVAESSFDAWIKYYRQDENTPNAVVSYYQKGSLVALCLDLLIRSHSGQRKSLDDVMRVLWERHGRTGVGVPEHGVEAIAEEVCGMKLGGFFNRALRSTEELPLAQLLAGMGIEAAARQAETPSDRGGKPAAKDSRAAKRADLGARIRAEGGEVRLTHVLDGGAAQRAGLSAGDILVALDGLRVNGGNLEALLSRKRPGDLVRVDAFRRDELMAFTLELLAPARDTWVLSATADKRQARHRARWLGAR
jgi:predicted metalloprotease with PDZ domain